jgi:hypothetical protein
MQECCRFAGSKVVGEVCRNAVSGLPLALPPALHMRLCWMYLTVFKHRQNTIAMCTHRESSTFAGALLPRRTTALAPAAEGRCM